LEFHQVDSGKKAARLPHPRWVSLERSRLSGTATHAAIHNGNIVQRSARARLLRISKELVYSSPDGRILDPDNFYHRHFAPVLKKSGIRKIRLHDLRHTFGSSLIQRGASIVYVKKQMGDGSIQVTVDTYAHLIPGANVSFVDRLDEGLRKNGQAHTKTQPPRNWQRGCNLRITLKLWIDLVAGGI
jgi:hypothetical protein